MPGVILQHETDDEKKSIPRFQSALLLNNLREPYSLTTQYEVPQPQEAHEILVKIECIGLNPIDWKAPDFGFGIPSFPHISGRDYVGTVVKAPSEGSKIKNGDRVVSISTDYRDVRKAAFQQFAIANDYNVCRLPKYLESLDIASVGVAFVAAALAFGICLGFDFSSLHGNKRGPDLLHIIRSQASDRIPSDIALECLQGIQRDDAPKQGDWIVIWGGSSTTAFFLTQLIKLAGCRVILIVDVAKHGDRLSSGNADLLVDSLDPDRAVDIVRRVTGGKLKYAVDTSGRDSATKLLKAFSLLGLNDQPANPTTGHLVGLTGLPKEVSERVVYHTVPIKIFHDIREVGDALTTWLETLLADGIISTPPVTVIEGSLPAINDALDIMRRGEVSGRRLVVKMSG